jgi:excisionase family DNA binding protein
MLRSVFVLQAAELLGVSRRTVYNRIRAGALKTVRTRCGSQRVLVESIEALLRERLRDATAVEVALTRFQAEPDERPSSLPSGDAG